MILFRPDLMRKLIFEGVTPSSLASSRFVIGRWMPNFRRITKACKVGTPSKTLSANFGSFLKIFMISRVVIAYSMEYSKYK